MKNFTELSDLKTYMSPQIELIKLDKEISILLQSTPAIGPGEQSGGYAPHHFNKDPFQNGMA